MPICRLRIADGEWRLLIEIGDWGLGIGIVGLWIAESAVASRRSPGANRQIAKSPSRQIANRPSPIVNLNRQSPLSIGNRQSTKSAVRSRHSAMN
jgi:hypothetical protein